MKNYLVIGASSGIGSTIKDQLVTEGHQVFGTYFSGEIPSQANVISQELDVRGEVHLDIAADHLDGLVYCPGSIDLKPFSRIKPEKFVEDYELQVIGAVKVIQAALPKLKSAESAFIVLFSTVAVQQGFNFHSLVASSKGAIEG